MTDSSIADTLAGHRFFGKLPADVRTNLATAARVVSFPTGGQLLAEGMSASTFYAITSGRVAVGVHSPNRGLLVIETLHSGDVVGWSWLIAPYRWHFDAVAVKPVSAIEFDGGLVRAYLDQDPRAGFELVCGIASVMAERLQSARMRLVDPYEVANAPRG